MTIAKRVGVGVRWLAALATVALAAPHAHADGVAGTPPLAWRISTSSPEPTTVGEDGALYDICGKPDLTLVEVAARNAGKQLRGESPFASDELGFTLRSSGGPQVWPRAWSIESKSLDQGDVEKRMTKWSDNAHSIGQKRCGIARSIARDGRQILSAVQVDALADLEPVPTLTRVGEWVTLKAHMLIPATDAKVVLLGPRGLPKTVLASLSGDDIRATFSVDSPGAWFVQVLATVETGPRPVLEAYVYAGADPDAHFAEAPAPGEDAGGGADPAVAMLAMINAARATEGLPKLAPDATLDKLALEHAKAMVDTKIVGHDVGNGDPHARVLNAGLSPRATGENVASASSLTRAHRALWASPSHRGNFLEKRFTNVGIGVVTDAAGRVWVAEIFTG